MDCNIDEATPFKPFMACETCNLTFHVVCMPLPAKPLNSPWECVTCTKKRQHLDHDDEPSTSTFQAADSQGADLWTSFETQRSELFAMPVNRHELALNNERVIDIQKRIAGFQNREEEVEKIAQKFSDLGARLLEIEDRYSLADQFKRVRNLELHGLVEYPVENLKQTVVLVGELVGVTVTETDLISVGRVGAFDAARPKPRVVLVKFHKQDLKNNLLCALRKRKGVKLGELGYAERSENVFVGENLTPLFREVYYNARQIFKYVWTYNCQIFVRQHERAKQIRIKSKRQLEDLKIFYRRSTSIAL